MCFCAVMGLGENALPCLCSNRGIRLMCLHPCCHAIQIMWWFLWVVTAVQFVTLNWVHGSMYEQNNWNYHVVWFGWQQGCKPVNRIRLSNEQYNFSFLLFSPERVLQPGSIKQLVTATDLPIVRIKNNTSWLIETWRNQNKFVVAFNVW